MPRSRFRSATSAALALAMGSALALAGAGCGDGGDSCGPGDAPDTGLVASGSASTLTFGQLTSRVGNDCPSSGAPAGVISLTIESTQTDGTGLLTLCVGRPDLLATRAMGLGCDIPGVDVRIIDLVGTTTGCTYVFDDELAVTGTAATTGMCGNGADDAGFALTVDGTASLTRTCGATVDTVPITLRGRVAVTPTK
jgi:hypothetical protein